MKNPQKTTATAAAADAYTAAVDAAAAADAYAAAAADAYAAAVDAATSDDAQAKHNVTCFARSTPWELVLAAIRRERQARIPKKRSRT